MLDLLIITGASRGIGASIVDKCSTICKTMVVIASSDKVESINSNNCNIIPLRLNLTDYNNVYYSVSNIVNNCIDNINSIGIVLCGAQLGEYGGLLDSDLNECDNLYKCNVLGNLAVIKACRKIIESDIKTRIVFFSGGGAAFPNPDFFGYSLSKVAVVRAVENLSIELEKKNNNLSIIALAPGAVESDMLKKVLAHCEVRTKTDINEPTNFVYNFLTDKFPSKKLNGKFLHVRDDIELIDFANKEIFKLRRIE